MPRKRRNAAADEDEEETGINQQPPKKMTRNTRGQQREYRYLKTLSSLEELDEFRFKNYCQNRASNSRGRNQYKKFILPCARKRSIKACSFELRAFRPDLQSGTIHVYAFSQHNHPLISEDKRLAQKNLRELMPDANPPTIHRTADNIEWKFLQTFDGYDKMQEFRYKNQCKSKTGDEKWWQIRFPCNRKEVHKCQFQLLAMKNTKNGYHVYKHGQHNHHHPALKSRNDKTKHAKRGEESEEEEKDENNEVNEEEENHDEQQDQVDEEKENALIQKQPPKKITKNVLGQMRKYNYIKTVKSMKQLDKFRRKNYCLYATASFQTLNEFSTFTMPCANKKNGKTCNFDLRAMRPDLKSGTIHVYAHGQHNHPILSKEERAIARREKYLMQHADPPSIIVKENNIEWTFQQTIPNYGKLQKFGQKNHSYCPKGKETCITIRFYCIKNKRNKCAFMFWAFKTTKKEYHVYKHGEHNHLPIIHSRTKKRQQSEDVEDEEEVEDFEDVNNDDNQGDEEEEKQEEEEEEEEDEEEDDDDQDEADSVPSPPKKIIKNSTVGDTKKYHYLKTVKSMEDLNKVRFQNYCEYIRGKPRQILKSCILPCSRKRWGKCDFELLALRPNLEYEDIHVYAHSQHNHPLISEHGSLRHIKGNDELMPDDNPPTILPDNIQWTFFGTFQDYGKLDKIRLENHCRDTLSDKEGTLIRYYCNGRYSRNCKFMIVAMKTTKQRYHVYTNGKHNNHPALKAIGEESEEEGEEEDEEEEVDEEKKDIKLIVKNEQEQQEPEEERLERLMEVKIIEIIEGNSREKTLKKKLAKANEKVYKWMAGIGPMEIGQTIGEWDKLSLLKMVEMADQEIRENPQKLNLWLPWLKCVIPKSLPQIQGFNVRFKDLIKLTFN